MTTSKLAMAAALALIALGAPIAARADGIADVSLNLTYNGESSCGPSGTSLCSETSTITFEWDNTSNSYVGDTATVTGSGVLGPMALYSPPSSEGSPSGSLVSLITSDAEGDLVFIDIADYTAGGLTSGAYPTATVDPPPAMGVTAYLVCGAIGDTCEFDYTGSASGTVPIDEVASFGTGSGAVQPGAGVPAPEPSAGIMLGLGLMCLMGMTLVRKPAA